MKQQLEQLATLWGIRIEYHELVESTNDLGREARFAGGDLVIAERQRAGRGQRGNRWSSRPGENLTFSIILTPRALRASRQFYLSKAVSLALTDLLAELGIEARIKWPNDIYVGDRKLIGILIENDLCDAYLSRSVVGIGLNVNQREFPTDLPNPTSLALELKTEQDRIAILHLFLKHLSERYGELDAEAWEPLDAEYLGRLYRLNEEHTFLDGPTQTPFQGTICDVEPEGALVIRHADGTGHRYLFKEVEYVL